MGPRVVLCLDMDAFFAAVECALRPELRGQPVVVGGHPEGRGVVTSASYEARAYGIHAAMPLAQARRLCPHAVFLPGQHKRYREASRQVRDILGALSPWVEMASIDEAFVDLTGTARALGPARQVAGQIQERIDRELGLPCSIGLAGNKLVAKVACSRAKPHGLLEVPAGREATFLAPLPVTAIPGIGAHTAARLAEVQIHNCGQLAAAPALLLERLLGKHAASLQRRARGVDRSPVDPKARPASSISRGTTFAQDSRDPALLRATLLYLVERVGHSLRRQGSSTACLTVQVRWADLRYQSHQRMLSPPTASDAVLCQAAGELLEQLLADGRQRVRLLAVRASHLRPSVLQLPMFDRERRQEERALELSRCLDHIRERYGLDAIQRGVVFALEEIAVSDPPSDFSDPPTTDG